MSDLIKCPSCRGTKRIMGMGMMEHDCKPCKGIGWIEPTVTIAPATEEAKRFATLGNVPVTYKKKGPPKGYNWRKVKADKIAAEAKASETVNETVSE
jgi:hypothetical protein